MPRPEAVVDRGIVDRIRGRSRRVSIPLGAEDSEAVQHLLRRQLPLVQQQQLVVRKVLDDFQIGGDVFKHCPRFIVAAQPAKREIKPVACRAAHVVVRREVHTPAIGPKSILKLTFEEVRESEVVIDIAVTGAGRDIPWVGQAIRLDLIGPALDQLGSAIEVADRVIESAQGDESMPAVSSQFVAIGILRQAVAIDFDRIVYIDPGMPAGGPAR